jgi:hypothetical protein
MRNRGIRRESNALTGRHEPQHPHKGAGVSGGKELFRVGPAPEATIPSSRHRDRYGCLRLSREFPTFGAIEAWPSQDDLARLFLRISV